MFDHIITSQNSVNYHGIDTAGVHIHINSSKVRIFSVIFQGSPQFIISVKNIRTGTVILYCQNFTLQISNFSNLRPFRNNYQLSIYHIGLGERISFLTLRVDCKAVPDRIDTLTLDLCFLGSPVDRFKFYFHTSTLAGFFSEVDIITDDLVLFITEAHRRKIVIKTYHHFFRTVTAAACNQRQSHQQRHSQK